MGAHKKAPRPAPVTNITDCNFQGGVSDQQAAALMALAQAMTEQAKAVQMVASALKGPDCLLKIGA